MPVVPGYELKAQGDTVYAKIVNKSGVEHELSSPISSADFNHIVLTYDKNAVSDQMKLFVDSNLKAFMDVSEEIMVNDNPLLIGGYNSIIDDVTIYCIAINP